MMNYKYCNKDNNTDNDKSVLEEWSKCHSLTCPERYTSNEVDIISTANGDKKFIVCKVCNEILSIL